MDLSAEIDPLVQALIDDKQMVGCVVGIVRDGETQVLAYGETEKGSGKAPNGKTIYEIGSSTKAFTGVLLADAVISGTVNLDDPLQEHVPKSIPVPMKDGKAITLEHLATHTSGLPSLPSNLLPKDLRNPYADYKAKQMAEFLKTHKLRRAPGEYEYSNYGMGLLGHVLAARQKKTYEQLLIERIAKPLAMRDTCITLTAAQKKRLAPPYNAAMALDMNWDSPALAGAGAIRSTTDDMLKFLQAALDDETKPVTKAMQMAFEKRHSIPNNMGIGLGWHIWSDGITRWHDGRTGGYSSWISVVPKFKTGVVVLSNTSTDKVTPLGAQLTSVVCGVTTAQPKEIALGRDVLKKYVGFYEITPEFGLNITEQDGKLSVQGTGQPMLPMIAEEEAEFFVKDVDARIFFVPNDEGDVNYLVLHQNGTNQRGKRVEPPREHQEIAVDREVLTRYVGFYEITPAFGLNITEEDGKLSVQATGQSKLPIFPESKTKFFLRAVDAQISFLDVKNGKASALILHQNGANQRGKRVEK